MNRKLTREELDGLREEIRQAVGDGWAVSLTSIDGVPADQYIPADDGAAMPAVPDTEQETSS